MFTGIIEEIGVVRSIKWLTTGAQFSIQASNILQDTKIGDSIAVNGCCVTIVDKQSDQWMCDIVQETLNRTNLQYLKVGNHVNLERAIRYQDRLNGHLVQGHVDGMGNILSKQSLPDHSWWVTIEATAAISRYIVLKGSIAIDGVSLTIADMEENCFSFAMIPHTARVTTLGYKQVGEKVNLEVDLMAKYAERILSPLINQFSQAVPT